MMYKYQILIFLNSAYATRSSEIYNSCLNIIEADIKRESDPPLTRLLFGQIDHELYKIHQGNLCLARDLINRS